VTGNVQLWKRSVTETFCRGDVLFENILYVPLEEAFFFVFVFKSSYVEMILGPKKEKVPK
jgi:hypothetical protein